jgi:uncharacterized protein YraI
MRFLAMTTAAVLGFTFAAAQAAPTLTLPEGPSASSLHLVQAASGSATVRVKSAILRAGPDTKSKKLASLRRGTRLTVVSQSGDWTQVKVGDQQGYVSTSLLTMR